MNTYVRCFKLVSGEEIVCEVVSDGDGKIVAKNVACITMVQGQGREIGIGIVPICMQAQDTTITVIRDKVVWTYVPEPNFAEQYLRIVNPSPIVTPQGAGGLVGPRGELLGSVSPPKTVAVGKEVDAPEEPQAMIVDNPNPPINMDAEPPAEGEIQDAEIVEDWKTDPC
jgi:hypothetical protein